MSIIVTPGAKLGEAGQYVAGSGVYAYGPYLFASLVGTKEIIANPDGTVCYD